MERNANHLEGLTCARITVFKSAGWRGVEGTMTSATLTGQRGSFPLGDNAVSNELCPASAGSDEHSDLLMRPLPLHHERVPFAVAWTPKAGCTSLVKWFLFQTGDLEKALDYDKWIHRYRVKVFQR